MANLLSISGIGKSSLEFLEAAGFCDQEALAKADVDGLYRELERANGILKIAKRAPAKNTVKSWIDQARTLTGIGDEPEPPAPEPVNYEQNPQVISMLGTAPFAIPLPVRILMDNHLAVPDIPPAILLNHYSGDLDVRVEQRIPQNRTQKTQFASNNNVQIAENVGQQRLDIDTSKIRSTEDMPAPAPRLASTKKTREDERVALIRSPLPETNTGRNPQSRRYIRGVLHTHPKMIITGAVVTLILMVLTPAAMISALLLLLSGEIPKTFGWVPAWLLAIPASLPVFGIAYLIWGMGGSCRICGQKLFMACAHLKNSKAHHVRGLGYVLPLCCHILAFRWFRCTHCGTPVRLKK